MRAQRAQNVSERIVRGIVDFCRITGIGRRAIRTAAYYEHSSVLQQSGSRANSGKMKIGFWSKSTRQIEFGRDVGHAIYAAYDEYLSAEQLRRGMAIATRAAVQIIGGCSERSRSGSNALIAHHDRRLSLRSDGYCCRRPNCDGGCARTNRLRHGTVSVRPISSASAE